MMTRDEIVAELVRRGAGKAKAVLYADAFVVYREATANIAEHGVIVLHPRTANPIDNPYLRIRDAASKMLRSIRGVDADFLW